MKVLMVSDVYFPRVNGVSTSIATFSNQLSKRDVTTQLIAPAYTAAQAEEDQIWRLPSRAVPLDPEDRIMRVRAIKTMTPQVAAFNPDLIHVHTPFAAHYGGLALARALDLPVIATYHTFFEEYLYHYCPFLPRAVLKKLARLISRHQGNAVDALVVPSQAMAARLGEYGVQSPMHVVPTGVPCQQFGQGSRHRFRHRFGIAESRPVALYVGRAAHEKNIDFLLRCAATVKRSVPDLMLVIAGEGPALSTLRALARQMGLDANVQFVGNLERTTELQDCYVAADLFVFASRTETQGLVLIEAMASHLPVLAIGEMGAGEVLAQAQSAAVTPADPQQFTEQWLRLFTDRQELNRLRSLAREDALVWDDAAMAERLLTVYEQVIAGYQKKQLHIQVSPT